MKIYVSTLGCKVNSYDSENILAQLAPLGGEVCEQIEQAEVIIVNTCAVTNESERKSRQLIRKLSAHNPGALLLVTGCYGETKRAEVEEISGVYAVTGTTDRDKITEIVASHFGIDNIPTETGMAVVTSFEEKTRAVVKVQDGCKMFCSYCVIPYARSKMQSAGIDSVLAQINEITKNGYKEVSLTGIHLASYRDGQMRLIDLLERINRESKLLRLRLGSLEPRLLTKEFLSRLAEVDCFCPHFHISLQSGATSVLKRMNRRYSAEEYFEITERTKEYFPNAALTTDIIVGFPGESEAEFMQSVDFADSVGFAHIHVFPFSPKAGTPAAEMENQISNAEKKRRVGELSRAGEVIRERVLRSFIGAPMQVLVEEKNAGGLFEGFSENYLRVQLDSQTIQKNDIVSVSPQEIRGNTLFCRI